VVDLDKYREDSLANWNKLSANWARQRDFLWSQVGEVSMELVDRVDPQPGQTILDVAAGTGDTGFLAAERVGPEGKVITTDFAPQMVEQARQAGERRGLKNVEYRTLDAERMDLDDHSVDGVVCRWGYMLMADPAKALAETRRVLRPDGQLAFAVWGAPDRNPWAFVPAVELVSRGHVPPPEPGTPGIFALADTGRLEEVVTGAGFAEPRIEEHKFTWEYGNVDQHWELTLELAGPLAEAIHGLDDDERESVRLAVRDKMESLMTEHEGVPGYCLIVTAS
jgi:SAM-dependent methyltransferase